MIIPLAPDPAHDLASGLDRLDEALVQVRRLLQRPDYRRRILRDLGAIELATLRLLRAVQRATTADGSGPSIGTVADLLVVDPSTASRIVDRAIESGLLDKRACSEDRRRARLALTPAGQAVLDEASRRRRELLTTATSDWSAREVDTLLALLERLVGDFDEVLRDAPVGAVAEEGA
ncbi:MAG: MarR family transcriptional regulator [Nitriliruptoraceae bacterium]|nr:MarR family transcriptional regulator [Nitriliruptoraceae bacterium]